MLHWVLILIIAGSGTSVAPAVATVEFNQKADCTGAGEKLLPPEYVKISWACVPKQVP
jgi:hypothetical protein